MYHANVSLYEKFIKYRPLMRGMRKNKNQNCVNNDINDPVLAEIVRRLVKAYKPKQIYLFGSKARGDDNPDSDYDLMVIIPDDTPPERRRSKLAYEQMWGTGVSADVLVWTEENFRKRLVLKASLPSTIQQEGIILYAA
jgi:hypothetical protein